MKNRYLTLLGIMLTIGFPLFLLKTKVDSMQAEAPGSSFKRDQNEDRSPAKNSLGFLSSAISKEGVVSLRSGSAGLRKKHKDGFDLQNQALVVERAKNILNEKKEELGLREGFPVEFERVRATPYSAQIEWRQKVGGRPVFPGGLVSLSIDRNGQTLALSSSYLGEIEIQNQVAISADKASQIASQSVVGSSKDIRAAGEVVWVTGTEKGNASHGARIAYEVWVGPHRVIVDSESGKLLAIHNEELH